MITKKEVLQVFVYTVIGVLLLEDVVVSFSFNGPNAQPRTLFALVGGLVSLLGAVGVIALMDFSYRLSSP